MVMSYSSSLGQTLSFCSCKVTKRCMAVFSSRSVVLVFQVSCQILLVCQCFAGRIKHFSALNWNLFF